MSRNVLAFSTVKEDARILSEIKKALRNSGRGNCGTVI